MSGSSIIVIGRPITMSRQPTKIVNKIIKDIRDKIEVEIKICGITNVETALASIGSRICWICFLFKILRYVSEPNVKNLMSYLNKDQKTVGLFVNSKIEEIVRISENLDLDFIQLHGYENVKFIKD